MVGKWEHRHRYGVEESYVAGMDWLSRCTLVEDWGCGPAYSSRYCKTAYFGVDGTEGYCDLVADLKSYRSVTPGIFMRHVLEHNHAWREILENALASFTERMSLIFFTPWQKETKVVGRVPNTDFPVIAFRKQDILDYIQPFLVQERVIKRKDKPQLYDTLFCLEKNKNNGET